MNTLALSFQDTQFDVIDRNGQPWLKQSQIASALYGIAKGGGQSDAPFQNAEKSLRRLYDRNADEFTDSMTSLIELDTNGGKQKVRVFSLRGCHLLAMFARTKVAKAFRVWALDIIDNHINQPPSLPLKKTQKALPGCLTIETQDDIKQLIQDRAAELPREKQAGFVISMWSSLGTHFGIKKAEGDKTPAYKHIPEGARLECLSLIARLSVDDLVTMTREEFNQLKALPAPEPLTGEVLPKQQHNSVTITLAPLVNGKPRCWMITQNCDELVTMYTLGPDQIVNTKEGFIKSLEHEGRLVITEEEFRQALSEATQGYTSFKITEPFEIRTALAPMFEAKADAIVSAMKRRRLSKMAI